MIRKLVVSCAAASVLFLVTGMARRVRRPARAPARSPTSAMPIARGWLSGPRRISRQYGSSSVWPGDTFGISTLAGLSPALMISWGGAVGGSPDSEIFAAPMNVTG